MNQPISLTRIGLISLGYMESGVHTSLHTNCHHQLGYGKFNFKIYYALPYELTVWHYGKSNIEQIRKTINQFGFGNNDNDIDLMVSLFNKTIKNILANYIPPESIISVDSSDLYKHTKDQGTRTLK